MTTPDETTKEESIRSLSLARAATRVFAEHGYFRATVDQVAEEAGVSKGTIYLYYDSKSDLLHRIFKKFENDVHHLLDRILTERSLTNQTLRNLVEDLAELAESHTDTVKILFDFWSKSMRSTPSDPIEFKSLYRRIRTKVQRLLKEGAEGDVFRSTLPDHLPHLLVAFFEGLLLHWLADPGSPSLRDLVQPAMDTVMQGITAS